MARAGRIFLLYVAATYALALISSPSLTWLLTSSANDICQKNGRTTVTGQDVINAIEETEFNPFLDPLNNTFQGTHHFRTRGSSRKSIILVTRQWQCATLYNITLLLDLSRP